MYVPFEELPATARIWIYQSDKKLTDETIQTISDNLLSFTNDWAAHNQPLKASYQVMFNWFVVLAVDEQYNEASGCSIDTSVHVMKQIGQRLKIDFFNRTNVAFLKKHEVTIIPLSGLTHALEHELWNGQTTVFNNAVHTKGEYQSHWMVTASETWLKRYLVKSAVQE